MQEGRACLPQVTTFHNLARQILFKQRKHAASILQSLVVANQKQLSIPVRTILKALQQVLLFKVCMYEHFCMSFLYAQRLCVKRPTLPNRH